VPSPDIATAKLSAHQLYRAASVRTSVPIPGTQPPGLDAARRDRDGSPDRRRDDHDERRHAAARARSADEAPRHARAWVTATTSSKA
jgi:hypothetical protein